MKSASETVLAAVARQMEGGRLGALGQGGFAADGWRGSWPLLLRLADSASGLDLGGRCLA